MPTLFDDLMSSAGVAMLFDTSGEDITCTPEGGQPVSLKAVLSNARTVEKTTTRGRHKVSQREATITNSPSSPYGGMALPPLNGTMRIGGAEGTDWSIVERNESRGGLWRLVLEQQEVIERTRPDYRAK